MMLIPPAPATTRVGSSRIGSHASRDDALGLGGSVIDPLDDDAIGDDVVVTTRRGICRVALVAAEAGGRFQREGLSFDPVAWMLSPRRLFTGQTAIDACLGRDACLRGVLLHGLSLGLDMDPETLDALTSDDEIDGVHDGPAADGGVIASTGEEDGGEAPSSSPVDLDDPVATGAVSLEGSAGGESVGRSIVGGADVVQSPRSVGDAVSGPDRGRAGADAPASSMVPSAVVEPAGCTDGSAYDGRLRLFTATLVACDGIRTVQAFHASLATDASQIAGRLYLRVGAAAAGAVIVEGLDPCAPLVEALVSPALIDALTMIAAQPQSPLATGLDLHVEQRFVS